MARFWGEVQGNRSPVSRTGTKDSGIRADIRGWDIGATVNIYMDKDGNDVLVLSVTGGSHNPNKTEVVYTDDDGKEVVLHIDKEYRITLPRKQKINLVTED